MTERLLRAIVGESLEPLIRGRDVPAPYRQTLLAPLAQKVQGSTPSEPREAEKPITEDLETDLNSL
jgi:hypothetical protein